MLKALICLALLFNLTSAEGNSLFLKGVFKTYDLPIWENRKFDQI
jgi:hypothetical protein